MDYVTNIDGEEVVIEVYSDEEQRHEQRDAMADFYIKILEEDAPLTEKEKQTIRNIAYDTTEQWAKNQIKQLRRMYTDAKKLINEFENYKNNLRKLIDFFEDQYKDAVRNHINGNLFLFNKDFPIEKYVKELYLLGEQEKDNSYSVYIDEKGELIIH